VLLAAQYGLGIIAKRIALQIGATTVCASVDVDHVCVSLLDRHVTLGNLRVIDPNDSKRCLLQVERCDLKLAAEALLHKRAVIENGKITGLQIDALTGMGGKNVSTSAVTSPRDTNWFGDEHDQVALQWLNQLHQQFDQDFLDKLASVRQCDALCARWHAHRETFTERATELDDRTLELQDAIKTAQANRLRHTGFIDDVPQKVTKLRQDFDQLAVEIAKCPAELDADRRAIVAARSADEKLLRDRLRAQPIDAEMLTAYLLRDQLVEPLSQLVGWLQGVRQLAPAKPIEPPNAQRGQNILFAGYQHAPNFLIRTLQLSGQSKISGKSVELRGTLTNASNAPFLHDKPIRLRLSSTGAIPLDIHAMIDRTGPTPRDELLVDCRDITLPQMHLGRGDQLEMAMAPSLGSLSISAIVDGEKLSGEIQLVQNDIRLTPTLHGELAKVPLVAPLQATLGELKSVATRLSIQGSLEKPSCSLWSNLGPATAEALARALERATNERVQLTLAEARRHVDERLAVVERQMADERQQIASQVKNANDRLEAIALQPTKLQRLSVERLGRQHPKAAFVR